MVSSLLPPSSLEPDSACVHLIAGFEAFRPMAYKPLPTDPWTIGYGYTGPDVHPGMSWTVAYAWSRLLSRVVDAADAVRALISTPTSQQQFNALVSLGYNVGAGALHGSQILAYHNARLWSHAAAQFPLWDHSGGHVVEGLLTRRIEEQKLYLLGSPTS